MFRKNIIKLSTTEYNSYLCKSCYCDRLSVSNNGEKAFFIMFCQNLGQSKNSALRVIQTQANSFFKTLSINAGSDIKRP